MSLRLVRSPVTPKITMMQGSATRPTRGLAGVGKASVRAMSVLSSKFVAVFLRLLRLRFRFDVSAELLPHGRKNFVGEGMFLARAKTRIQRGCQHFRWNCFFNGSLDGPSSFARILHEAAVFG